MAKGQIKARVQCTIEIQVGVWGGGTTDLDALTEQVRREGEQIVRNMVTNNGGGLIIGTPRVFFIVLSEEK